MGVPAEVCAERKAAETRACKPNLGQVIQKVLQDDKEHKIWLRSMPETAEVTWTRYFLRQIHDSLWGSPQEEHRAQGEPNEGRCCLQGTFWLLLQKRYVFSSLERTASEVYTDYL